MPSSLESSWCLKLVEFSSAKQIAGGGAASPAQVALAWCTAKGASVIPGARTLRQAESNIAAASLLLTAAEVERLDVAAALVPKAVVPEQLPFPKKDVFTGMQMIDS